jgi:tetratricopeptide (TPR) repeat protein
VAALIGILASFGSLGYMSFDAVWGSGRWERAARQAIAHRDFAGALSNLDRYLQSHPSDAAAHLLAARAARRSIEPILPGAMDDVGRSTTAVPGAADALPRFQHHLSAYRRLGGSPDLAQLEEWLLRAQSGALTDVEEALKRLVDQDHPDTPLIFEALVKGYLLAYRLPEAEGCLKRWLDYQEDVQALLWHGWVRERLVGPKEGLVDYRRAVALDSDYQPARLWLAEALSTTAQPEEALDHYQLLLTQQPDNPAIRVGMAQCHRELNHLDEGRQLLDGVLADHPDHVAALLERGKLALHDEEKPAEALSFLERAAALAPHNYQVAFALAQALQQTGRADEARICRDRVQKIQADLQRLIDLTRAVGANPGDPQLRWEAGTILLRNGYDAQGLRWLQSALQYDPRHVPSHQALADYYDRHGQSELAAPHRRRLPIGG